MKIKRSPWSVGVGLVVVGLDYFSRRLDPQHTVIVAVLSMAEAAALLQLERTLLPRGTRSAIIKAESYAFWFAICSMAWGIVERFIINSFFVVEIY